MIGAAQDEIHDLNRRVDDAEAIRVLLEGRGEELLVEFHQHVLPRFAVVEATGAHTHAFVEALQIPRFVLQPELPEILPQGVQRLRHLVSGGRNRNARTAPRRPVASKMCCAIISMALSRVIESLIETLSSSWKASNHSRRVSLSELARRPAIRWTSREKMSATSLAQVSQYFRSPAFLDDLGEDRAGRQIQRRKGQFERAGTVTRTVDPVAAEDDPIRRRVVEVDLVDLGIEPVVVRA